MWYYHRAQARNEVSPITTITVLSPPPSGGGYRAVAEGREAAGDTPGRAIDALVEQTGPHSGATLIIIQARAGDEFFSDAQRQRLAELMARWRAARDTQTPYPTSDQVELEALVAAELKAAAARSAALLRAAQP
jgi:hypothetical protein